MDPQFEALAAQIARDVTAAVSENVTEAVTERLTAAVTEKVTTDVNVHVTDVLTAAERRLASQARAHMEAVRSEARMATENYGALLETINRRLDRIEEKVTDNHRDTAAILKKTTTSGSLRSNRRDRSRRNRVSLSKVRIRVSLLATGYWLLATE